jgi:hypothetical protein
MSQLNGNLGATERWISALLGAGFTLAAIGSSKRRARGLLLRTGIRAAAWAV